jgi:hypothetical protein
MRHAFDAALAAMAQVDADLAAAARDPAFSLELCLACWEHDWNGNGEVDEGDRLLLQVEYDADGNEIPEADPRRKPTFRFDVGDVHWARAMLSFQRAGIELIRGYDWSELDAMFRIFGSRPDVVRFRLAEPARIGRARDLILAGLDHADLARLAYLAETDDDREWVPSPTQKNHPFPLPVDAALYDTWAGVVSDVRGLLRGETGLSAAEALLLFEDDIPRPPKGFVDVGGMFARPHDIVLDLGAIDRITDSEDPDLDALAREFFGSYYVDGMKPTPLVGRLRRMRDDLSRGEDTLERKLRYLLWLN